MDKFPTMTHPEQFISPQTHPSPRKQWKFYSIYIHIIKQGKINCWYVFLFLPQLCIFSCSNGFPMFSTAITFGGSLLWDRLMLWVDSSNTSTNSETNAYRHLPLRSWEPGHYQSFVLTILPSVASPSSPPKVITGDIQAQYRKRIEARHCRLNASLKSLKKKGAFLLMSSIKPPKSLNR